MAYDKNDILNIPELKPERHYESEGAIKEYTPKNPSEETTVDEPLVETLDDLDRVYSMAELLPTEVRKIVQNIVKVLQTDTQGKIIEHIENPTDPAYVPVPSNTKTDDTPIVTPIINDNTKSADVKNIFSIDPGFTIKTQNGSDLYTFSVSGYIQDDVDIKRHYTSMMEQIISYYFQTMSAIADDCGMPDYSYLQQTYDGKAVTIADSDYKHLRDFIVKSQAIRDQKTRQLEKTHTAENTLIMQRCWYAAEKKRERYLKESYKKNVDSLGKTCSNDLLGQNRDAVNKDYKKCMYNNYKFLDSGAKLTSNVLDMHIQEAGAKAALVDAGSNIFAITPEPMPTPNSIDDNDATTSDEEKKISQYIAGQAAGASKGGSGRSGGAGTIGTASQTVQDGLKSAAANLVGVRMSNGTEGCVEAATKIGSYYSKFLLKEVNNGVVYAPTLVSDAQASGVAVISFDSSQLVEGDVIVYGDDDHVVIYNGKNGGTGYIGNSSSQVQVIEGSDFNEMSGLSPTKIIKTSVA